MNPGGRLSPSILLIPYYGAKEAVLPWARFPGVDPILGPEMRSTGEVLGMASDFGLSFYKSQEAAGAVAAVKNEIARAS